MIKILYINDDPQPLLIAEAFENLGIAIELIVIESVEDARRCLQECPEIDVVFMDYVLGGMDETAVSSGLVKMCLDKGFGTGKKPLIAYSQGHNKELLRAGCSHFCRWSDLDELVYKLFTV